MTGSVKVACVFVVLAAAGAAGVWWKTVQDGRQLELKAAAKASEAAAKADARKKAEAEKLKAEAERRTAEANKARAEAEKAKKATDLEKAKQDGENEKTRLAAAKAEKEKSESQRAAAEAETKRSEEAKAAADAEKAAADAKAELESKQLARAREERRKAEAELADRLAAKAIADAALAKSENERKTAEANAEAERDRKLRMYRRAETSRAEMLELKRAERMLALEESGQLQQVDAGDRSSTDDSGQEGGQTANNDQQATPIAVEWYEEIDSSTPAEKELEKAKRELGDAVAEVRMRRARTYVRTFEELIKTATREDRIADAKYYRKTLVSLVPNYVEVYTALAEDAHRAGNDDESLNMLKSMMELVPEASRVAVFIGLLTKDGARNSDVITHLATKGEYVTVFRKMIDRARRDDGDRDDREERMDKLLETLARHVPDYASMEEWK